MIIRKAALIALLVSATAAQRSFIEPMGGYTQVVSNTDAGVTTVYVSGQIGSGPDFSAHARSVFAEVQRRLAQAGGGIEDVVKTRVFVKDLDADRYRDVAEARRSLFPEGAWPASTVVGVDQLAREAFQVEVEATAIFATEAASLSVRRFAPGGGISGAVAATANGITTIYVSGQVGSGDDFAARAATTWDRIGARLREAGASYADLVKTTTYVVGFDPAEHLEPYRRSYPDAVRGSDDKPASTLLGVAALASTRFDVEIDAVAVVGAGRDLRRHFIDPAGNYSQAVAVQGDGHRTVYISGQVGRPGDSLAEQADQVYANLAGRLQAAGAGPDDLLKITVYIPGYTEADLAALGAARERHGFSGDRAPASTLLGIRSLYSPRAAIEIEGIAVVGGGG